MSPVLIAAFRGFLLRVALRGLLFRSTLGRQLCLVRNGLIAALRCDELADSTRVIGNARVTCIHLARDLAGLHARLGHTRDKTRP